LGKFIVIKNTILRKGVNAFYKVRTMVQLP